MEYRHLLSGYSRELFEISSGREYVRFSGANTDIPGILAQCPQTIKEKAHKLLKAIHRKTDLYGKPVSFDVETDYPLAYAVNTKECLAFLRYLVDCVFLTQHANIWDKLVLTASGFEAIESQTLLPPTTVFISSTCYDLVDLRAELTDFLDGKGYITKASDDPYRMEVEPTEDSILSCKRSVESADVVVCVLDGRYGPPLPPDKEISATHAEIRHAREKGIPVYILARDKALSDFDQLRNNNDAKTLWVEPRDDEQRKRWLTFAKGLQGLTSAQKTKLPPPTRRWV